MIGLKNLTLHCFQGTRLNKITPRRGFWFLDSYEEIMYKQKVFGKESKTRHLFLLYFI